MRLRLFLPLGLALALDAAPRSAGAEAAPIVDAGLPDAETAWAAAESAFDASLQAQGVPGATLAVVIDGHLKFTHVTGVSQLGSSAMVQPTTLFQWASVTKVLTSISIQRLVERHALAFTAPITRYLPELHVAEPNAAVVISLDQMLHHSSGLPSGNLPSDPAIDVLAPDYLPRYLTAHELPQLSPSGRIFNYSNLGFAMLGLIAERAGKRPYEQVVHDEVFVPAGMTAATLDPKEAARVDHAQGYSYGSGGLARIEPDTVWAARYRRPFGGLEASAIDVAHLAEALLDDGRLLPKGGLELMTAGLVPTGETPTRSYGRGIFVEEHRGVRLVYHHGEQAGFSSVMMLVPERKLAVVLAANLSGYNARAMGMALVDLFLALPGPDAPLNGPPATWRKYQGKFFDPTLLQHYRVHLQGEHLMLTLVDLGFSTELVPVGGDSFTFRLPSKLGEAQRTGTFFLDARGRAEYFALTNAVGARE